MASTTRPGILSSAVGVLSRRVEEPKQAAWGAEVLSSDGPSSAVGGVPSLLEDSGQTSRP